MTKAEWDHVADSLTKQFSPVGLICDGYHLCLCLERCGMRLVIAFYVNGVNKGAWVSDDCEERRRFLRPVKKSAWSAKNRATIKKMSKRMLKSLNVDPTETFTVHYPWWTSFKALKAHLVKHNASIELAPDWRYQAEKEAL